MNDEQIEALVKRCGGRWTGDFWEIEDADLHPMIRAAIAASNVQPKGTAASVPEWKREARQAAEGKQAYYRDMMRQAREAREDAQAPAPEAHTSKPNGFSFDPATEKVSLSYGDAQAPEPGAVELPPGLSRSDAEFWLRKRGEIIDALRAEGLTMVTTMNGVQFMRLGRIEAQSTDEVAALVRQAREVCAATLRAGPGVAVEIPAKLAEEGRKFMRGEPNLIEQMPFADVQKLGDLLGDSYVPVQGSQS